MTNVSKKGRRNEEGGRKGGKEGREGRTFDADDVHGALELGHEEHVVHGVLRGKEGGWEGGRDGGNIREMTTTELEIRGMWTGGREGRREGGKNPAAMH